MALLSKFLFTAKMVLSFYISAIATNQNQFVYLNMPETLIKPGIVHKKQFTKSIKARYFVHFKNGTNSSQNFSFKSKYIIDDFKKSFSTNIRPEFSGARSVYNFLTSKPSDAKLNATTLLLPDETISGIFEGDFQKGDTLLCTFGKSNQELDNVDIYQSAYKFDFTYDLDLNKQVSYKLGSGIENTVAGQYGSNITIKITPKKNGLLRFSFSPRGGDGLLVYQNRGKIFMTKLLPAKKEYDAICISVDKNKPETFTFIPTGGLNFPIQLNFKLIDLPGKNIA
jgi:hypothetical protein